MKNTFISIKEDISRLIEIFDAEIYDNKDKEITIFCYRDKRLPPNSIVYHHEDSLNNLAVDGVLKILESDRNIDVNAPNFVGPYFYKVLIFAQKVKEIIQANQTISKRNPLPLPVDAALGKDTDELVLTFGDKKEIAFYDIREPSAQYFLILLTNHGLPVRHGDIISKGLASSNKKVRDLKKTLVEKIEHEGLSTRIRFSSKFTGAYTMLIT